MFILSFSCFMMTYIYWYCCVVVWLINFEWLTHAC